MSALETYFYHKTIRTYTAAFGTLFNNLKIQRSDGKIIKVPLAYASRQKFDVEQKYESTDAHIKTLMPRMAFNMVGFQRDPQRMLSKHNFIQDRTADRETATNVGRQLNRIPYLFNYELYIQTKNLEDLLQLIEQICAWFNPSLEINITDNPDLNMDTSITVKMDSNSLNDSFEGLMEDAKILQATLSFEMEGYLYMPTGDQGIIKKINLNYYDLDDPSISYGTDVITE